MGRPAGKAEKKLHRLLHDLRDDVGLTQGELADVFCSLDPMCTIDDRRISEIERILLPSWKIAILYDTYFGTGDNIRKLTKQAWLERHGFVDDVSAVGFRFTAELTTIDASSTIYPHDENTFITADPGSDWMPSYRRLKPVAIIDPGEQGYVSFVFDFGVTVSHRRRTVVFDSVADLGKWREEHETGSCLAVTVIGHNWTGQQLPAALRTLASPKSVSRSERVTVDLTGEFERRFINDDMSPPATTDFSVAEFFYGAATATSYAACNFDNSTVIDDEILSYFTQLQAVKYFANLAISRQRDSDLKTLRKLRVALKKPLQQGRQYRHVIEAIKQASEIDVVVDHAIEHLELDDTRPAIEH